MSQDELACILAGYKENHDLAALARKMNIPYSSLARILNENDTYDLGTRKLVSFIEATDYDFTLLDHIESRLGRVAMKVETDSQARGFEQLSNLAKETGEALKRIEAGSD